MRLTERISYPASPLDVFSMLTDETFQHHKCEATGALSHTVGVQVTPGDGVTITTTRVLPTDAVPDHVRSLIGKTLTVTQTEAWGAPGPGGEREGTVTVEIVGVPVRLNGTMTLTTEPDGALEVIDGELKASVPFLGGKIEQAAAPAILSAIRVEHTAGLAWLQND